MACLLAPGTAAQEPGPFEYLEEEARVLGAALQPKAVREAPGTVHILTASDIEASGAQTLWDALRAVPGVDVMAPRAFQGEVSIRGMGKPLNNRTLVLLDGRTVLNGFFEYANWESIPVALADIDRIEVVAGPASPIFGPNAMHGVINIVTKLPEQIAGTVVSAAAGERQTLSGRAAHGRRRGPVSYKLSLRSRSGKQFEDARLKASESASALAWAGYDLADDATLALSGGATKLDAQINDGPRAFERGVVSFARADAAWKDTRARVFWNRGRTRLEPHALEPRIDWDSYDASLFHAFSLPLGHRATAGTELRRSEASSNTLGGGRVTQDLVSLLLEDTWRPAPRVSVIAGARADRHPFVGWTPSYRASLVYGPAEAHTSRLTAGTAFRNPTPLENHARIVQASPSAVTTALGSTDLEPERIRYLELAHSVDRRRWSVSAAAFHYRLTEQIAGRSSVTSLGPPAAIVSIAVNQGETRVTGGELWGGWTVVETLRLTAAYSLQAAEDAEPFQVTARTTPRHKANAGLDWRERRWTASLWGRWVDRTFWPSNGAPPFTWEKVPAYVTLNAAVKRRLAGRWEGLELGVSGFNLVDEHNEIGLRRQNGEVLRRRVLLTGSYRFP
ncbi:MAG: TonB-dependent receptor [Elusimicrobia bacterium]|nr:TonB-dependent receptor [Elusimicrobiota bacterium]